jgi:hypothetical protein
MDFVDIEKNLMKMIQSLLNKGLEVHTITKNVLEKLNITQYGTKPIQKFYHYHHEKLCSLDYGGISIHYLFHILIVFVLVRFRLGGG